MPRDQVSVITDQEIAFARLVLAGTMSDRDAAQAVGLDPDTAAHTKSRPRVRAFMIERRAAARQQLTDQLIELETEGLRRPDQRTEQVLDRLWQTANLSHEMTRGSLSIQLKALSKIVEMEGFIPDHRAVKKSTPAP